MYIYVIVNDLSKILYKNDIIQIEIIYSILRQTLCTLCVNSLRSLRLNN
jgi:hypothetical protein